MRKRELAKSHEARTPSEHEPGTCMQSPDNMVTKTRRARSILRQRDERTQRPKVSTSLLRSAILPHLSGFYGALFTGEPVQAYEAFVHGACLSSGGVDLHRHCDSVVRRDCSVTKMKGKNRQR